MGRKAKLKKKRREERERMEFMRSKKRDQLLTLLTSNQTLYSIRRAMLRAGAKSNSCILAARVYVDLATSMGFNAFGMTVETTVINEVLWDWMNEHGFTDDRLAGVPEFRLQEAVELGSKMVVLGARDKPDPTAPGNWPGHMVAVIGDPGDYRVVDLSIDQATRRKHDIVLRPSCFMAPDSWVAGETTARGFRPMLGRLSDKRVIVECQAYPDDTSFESAPDWSRHLNPIITTNERGIHFQMDPLE